MAVKLDKVKRPKGTPPTPAGTSNNLLKPASGTTVPLQVNIDPEVKRDFRLYAVGHDIDMSDLFTTMWQYYKENHG